MKKCYYILLASLLGMANSANAADATMSSSVQIIPTMSVPAMAIEPNRFAIDNLTKVLSPGETFNLPIQLINEDSEICAAEFTILLPNGIEPVLSKSGKYVVTLNEDRKDDHTASANFVEKSRIYKVVIMSMNNYPFYEKEGVLATIPLKAADDAKTGEYTINFTGIAVSFRNVEYNPASVDTKIKVKAPGYLITTSATEGGTVTASKEYEMDETASVVATPSAGYRFVAWMEGDTEVANTAIYTFEVVQARILKAVFAKLPSYMIETSCTEGGTVTASAEFVEGTSATVVATPSKGYKFVSWMEGTKVVSSNPSYTFEVEGTRELRAIFDVAPINEMNIAGGALSAGDEFTFPITLENADSEICALQFELHLPAGIKPALDNKGKLKISLDADRKDDHTIASVYDEAKGIIRAVVMSMNNYPFYENEGTLVNVGLKVDEKIATGSYDIQLKGIVMASYSNVEYECEDKVATFDIEGVVVVPDNWLNFKPAEFNSTDNYVLDIDMNNLDSEVCAFQFSLVLPEGIVPVYKNGKVVMSLNSDRIDDHSASSAFNPTTRILTVVVISLNNYPFYENEGKIVSVTLKAEGITETGEYDIVMNNAYMTSFRNVEYALEPITRKFKVVVTSLQGTNEAPISVWPTVLSDKLNIENAEGAVVTVVNVAGQTVATQTVTSAIQTIPTSNWASGLYNVIIAKDGKQETVKVVK